MRHFLYGGRSRRLLALFLVATCLPAAALVWLGWRLVVQDAELEVKRVEDLLDRRAIEVTSVLNREMATLERDLPAMVDGNGGPPNLQDALLVRLTTSAVSTRPGTSQPTVLTAATEPHEPSPDAWLAAEQLEFARRDLSGATAAYRALANSADPDVRAGALVRLARALRTARREEDALETYAAIARETRARIDGDPADLVARVGRIDVLRSLSRADVATREAAVFMGELAGGRWLVSPAAYEAYSAIAAPERPAPTPLATALALAVGDVWTGWQRGETSHPRHSTRIGDVDVFINSREDGDGLVVLATTPDQLSRWWLEPLGRDDVSVTFLDEQERPLATTSASTDAERFVTIATAKSGLPWTIRVATTGTPATIAESGRTRRGVLIAGLALLAVLLPASGYLVVRAVRRELVVARQQANFVSAVSHEFRSPLTSLTHLTSLLRTEFQPTESRRRQYYDILAHETERLQRFVETLLDFGRMQAGVNRYRLKSVDLSAFVRMVVDEFQHDSASDGRRLSSVLPAAVPPVSADEEALGRALWNLLENAVKYSPRDAPITVHLDVDETTVAIRVIDQGAGIPEEEQPHVFQQFYRGAAAIESAIRGTGVGLAVVQHIVKGHGGDVQLVSRPGEGSTFSIVLPLLKGEAVDASSRRAS